MLKNKKIDTDFKYDCLIDMKAEQLNDLIKECEITIERTRGDIVKNYEQAQPYLLQMRMLKGQLRKTEEKLEAAKTFLSMEKNGTLISSLDLVEMKKIIDEPIREILQPVSKVVNPTKFKSQSPLVSNWIKGNQKSKSEIKNNKGINNK